MTAGRLYHIGFGPADLPEGTTHRAALGRSGPQRADRQRHLGDSQVLARNRGLDSFLARLPGGAPVVCATSGMGAPSMSIVVNELHQAGIRTVIRVGTSGAIHPGIEVGSVVITVGGGHQPGRGRRRGAARVPRRGQPVPHRELAEPPPSSGSTTTWA